MSYDFILFKRRPGEDPYVTAQRDSEQFATTPPDPEKEALKRRVADALIAHNPKLEVFQLDHEAIAKFDNITVEEARLKYRYLELNGPEDDTKGIQITLFDDEASVTVPYWHQEDEAGTFREILDYLEIISRETGYLVYDPQGDSVFDPSEGFDDPLERYSEGVQQLDQALTGSDERKPWWKFW